MKTFQKYIFAFFLFILFSVSAFSQQTAEEFYKQGVEQAKSGRYKEAIVFFTEAIRLKSDYTEAYLERSRARQASPQDLKGAFADVETVLQLNPQFGEAYYERSSIRYKQITEMLQERGTMTSEEISPFQKLVLEDLNSAITYGYKNKHSYSARASMYSRTFRDFQKAIEDYTSALSFDPEDFNLLISRSLAKKNSGDIEGAVADMREIISRYDKAVQEEKKSPEKVGQLKLSAAIALSNLSSIYAVNEDSTNALWAINKSIELNPFPMTYASRGRHKTIFGELDDAIADFNKAIELSQGKSGSFFIERGVALHLQGKTAEAKADFDKAVELEPFLKNRINYLLELTRRQREQKRIRVELPKCCP